MTKILELVMQTYQQRVPDDEYYVRHKKAKLETRNDLEILQYVSQKFDDECFQIFKRKSGLDLTPGPCLHCKLAELSKK